MSAQGASGSPSLGRRTYQKGLQTIIWRADDDNEDDLAYEVRYRREGETTWKVLRRDLTESVLVWDTTTVPNGTYFAKVVASDSPSNAAGTASSGSWTGGHSSSKTRRRDCRPEHAVRRRRRSYRSRSDDDHSPVQRVEYSRMACSGARSSPPTHRDSKTEHYE